MGIERLRPNVSWSDSSIVAIVPSGLTGGQSVDVQVIADSGASNTVSLNILNYKVQPQDLNMLVGDSRTLLATDLSGNPVTGLGWSTSDPTVVTLSTDDPPVITAVGAGSTKVWAGDIPPSSIERKTVDFGKDTSHAGNFFTPFYDGFYAMCDGGQLCKWSDAGFEPATPEEQRQFGGVDHLVRGDMNNKNINGWSVYEIARSPGNLQVSVGGKFTIAIDVKATFAQGDAKFSIYLLRPGRPEETLYVGDGTPKLISAAEYKRDFPPGTALKE